MTPLLQVKDLGVRFTTSDGPIDAVDGVSFEIRRSETLALVGESGAGKTVSALALLGLIGASISGRALFDGVDLLRLRDEEMDAVRGRRIGMIFQDPSAALNPTRTVGSQVAEVFRTHARVGRVPAHHAAVDLLSEVGIPDPRLRARQFPHELSGGMQQRVVIAMAVAMGPDLLIADEPTTALDVTVQAEIIALLRSFRSRGLAMLLISHDLALVSENADRIAVMYAGRIVETSPARKLMSRPRHPYTVGLLSTVPRIDRRIDLRPIQGSPPDPSERPPGCAFHPRCSIATDECRTDVPRLIPAVDAVACHHDGQAVVQTSQARTWTRANPARAVIEVRDLRRTFRLHRGRLWRRGADEVRAVDGVSFALLAGETLGLVGESGSGKTTIGRCLLGLLRPTSGTVEHPSGRRPQAVFQDPLASFDPRMTLLASIEEAATRDGYAVGHVLDLTGLDHRTASRYPHEVSSGQRQRAAIARALISRPDAIVCDEPVSSLDGSIQAQVLRVLTDLQEQVELTMLFITHNLAVVRQVAHRVAVLHAGRIVEIGSTDQVLGAPAHPYTQSLVRASPQPPISLSY